MTEHSESADWDETVDVLCVGDGPGALAYGLYCAADDLDVLIIESTDLDPQTAAWRDAMTEDLGGCPMEADLSLIHAESVPAEKVNDRTVLEPFVGEHLRQWSARCLASPFGVVTSHVPDLAAMRTADGQALTAGIVGGFRCEDGRPGRAVTSWLRDRAEGLFGPAEDRLDGLIVEEGRIAGVVLDTAEGPCRIGLTQGLALSLGAIPECWPEQSDFAGRSVDVAVIGRRAGRFATVGLLAQ